MRHDHKGSVPSVGDALGDGDELGDYAHTPCVGDTLLVIRLALALLIAVVVAVVVVTLLVAGALPASYAFGHVVGGSMRQVDRIDAHAPCLLHRLDGADDCVGAEDFELVWTPPQRLPRSNSLSKAHDDVREDDGTTALPFGSCDARSGVLPFHYLYQVRRRVGVAALGLRKRWLLGNVHVLERVLEGREGVDERGSGSVWAEKKNRRQALRW
eukprot:4864217-Prymnesium_polylepis.2